MKGSDLAFLVVFFRSSSGRMFYLRSKLKRFWLWGVGQGRPDGLDFIGFEPPVPSCRHHPFEDLAYRDTQGLEGSRCITAPVHQSVWVAP